jgi:diguanylate cyclase (GGDEF)-like protein
VLYERPSHPGRRTIIASILLVDAAQLLLLIAAVAVSRDTTTAAAGVMLAALVLGAAVWTAWAGLIRIGKHLRDEYHRLERALTDPVTGLPVRRTAEDAIAGTDPDVALTVALADVDRLHEINHGPGGHAAGDRYLAETGRRLRKAAVDGDIVARLGGDEFVLITRRAPQQVIDSLASALAAPTAVAGFVRPVEISIGISQLPGGDPHQLLSCSSLAMFTAKDRGTGIEVYDPARDGLPLPPGVRPTVRRRDRRPAQDRSLGQTGAGRPLPFDKGEAAGVDRSSREGDARFPYTTNDLPRSTSTSQKDGDMK